MTAAPRWRTPAVVLLCGGLILMLALAAVFLFFAGMAAGGFLFAYTDEPPLRLAANDVAAHTVQPVPPITR